MSSSADGGDKTETVSRSLSQKKRRMWRGSQRCGCRSYQQAMLRLALALIAPQTLPYYRFAGQPKFHQWPLTGQELRTCVQGLTLIHFTP